MTEGATIPPRTTAGALLRAARERQGLHIAALAAAIKVAPRKLDALEHDRYDELPDATFTRALAQTVCRSLKIDPQPVLALLPLAEPVALDQVARTLNTPFRERPGRDDGAGLAVAAIRPMVWAGVGLLLAAGVVYFLPAGMVLLPMALKPTLPASAVEMAASPASAPASAPPLVAAAAPASAASEPASAPAPIEVAPAPVAIASAPVPNPVPPLEPLRMAAAVETAASAPTLVQLRASGASWVEARDGQGRVVFSRTVQAGEDVGFNGALPVRLTIGNAPATRVTFRGQAVDLGPSTRDNVARLELQ